MIGPKCSNGCGTGDRNRLRDVIRVLLTRLHDGTWRAEFVSLQ